MQWVSGRTVRHTLETAGTMKRQARPVITTEVNEKAGRQRRCALFKLILVDCLCIELARVTENPVGPFTKRSDSLTERSVSDSSANKLECTNRRIVQEVPSLWCCLLAFPFDFWLLRLVVLIIILAISLCIARYVMLSIRVLGCWCYR